jgi:UDP:flavonoid glycosyltransferase YjiC (YdhE family)
VLSGTAIFPGFPIAESLGIPACAGVLQPLSTTTAFENAFFPACPRWFPARGLYHRLTHLAFMALVAAFFGKGIQPMRRRLELPPMTLGDMFARLKSPPGLTLYGISPSVLPQPTDWPACCRMTGYWFLDAADGWTPPADLEAFLEDGPPPVYIGFGSMRNEDPAAMARIVVQALERAGQRGILFRGWGGLQPGDLPPTIHAIDPVPHAWLFQRMAAVAHHGGAGTTAATFRAGVPGIAMPVFADQPFWARQVQRLGTGPAPVPHWQLTPDRLADAIRQAVEDPHIRANAAALGQHIRAEDGVSTAVHMIEDACATKTMVG